MRKKDTEILPSLKGIDFRNTREDADKMKAIAEAYFCRCRKNEVPISIPGLTIALGFGSREWLKIYKGYEIYSDLVDYFLTVIEEDLIINGSKKSAVFTMFRLKNLQPDFYKDKTENMINLGDKFNMFEGRIEARAKKYIDSYLGKSNTITEQEARKILEDKRKELEKKKNADK